MEKAYLDKKFCEYRVVVWDVEAAQELSDDLGEVVDALSGSDELKEKALEIAALKILRDFKKPINANTKQKVLNAASIVENYRNYDTTVKGYAHLISVPAFNFDQIPDSPVEDKSDDKDPENPDSLPTEIKISDLEYDFLIKFITIKASYNTTSAVFKAKMPFKVINSGSPGPAPTKLTLG